MITDVQPPAQSSGVYAALWVGTLVMLGSTTLFLALYLRTRWWITPAHRSVLAISAGVLLLGVAALMRRMLWAAGDYAALVGFATISAVMTWRAVETWRALRSDPGAEPITTRVEPR